MNILRAQTPLLIVYSAYSAVYMRLRKSNQTAFIFVLPVINFVLKNSLAKASAGLADFIPTIVISIDLFNAVYQLKSMRSSETIWITVGIVSIDFALKCSVNAATASVCSWILFASNFKRENIDIVGFTGNDCKEL